MVPIVCALSIIRKSTVQYSILLSCETTSSCCVRRLCADIISPSISSRFTFLHACSCGQPITCMPREQPKSPTDCRRTSAGMLGSISFTLSPFQRHLIQQSRLARNFNQLRVSPQLQRKAQKNESLFDLYDSESLMCPRDRLGVVCAMQRKWNWPMR